MAGEDSTLINAGTETAELLKTQGPARSEPKW